MMVIMGIVLSLAVLLTIFVILYLSVFIRPAKKREADPELLCDYAHRGLHGNGIPENSLAAFELACRSGFGIELDVQLSRDGEVVVFHDYTLNRMTGVDKKLCELDSENLCELRLLGTDHKIPTFRQVLELVGGRVPLLVELKGENFDTSLCPKVAEILNEYSGKYCIESFNPLLVKQMKSLMPQAFCGLLYTNAVKEKNKASIINIAVSSMLLNFLCKPDFIAYNEDYKEQFCLRAVKSIYKPYAFVWTVKSLDLMGKVRARGEHSIFEKIDRS